MKNLFVKIFLSLIIGVASMCSAYAQDAYPSRLITIVVPFPAGSVTDNIARVIQTPLSKVLGQPVIIDNKPGASGVIAAKHVQAAAPDGYTILMPTNGLVIPPIISSESGYDAEKSFEPIVPISKQPLVLAVHQSVHAKNLREFIEEAKLKPGEVTFASSGPESITHAFTELFAKKAGIKILQIPYKGQSPALQAVYAGDVNAMLNVSSGQMRGFAENGKIRLLGVSSVEQTPLAPGVPTIATEVPGFSGDVWFGFFAPKGVPAPVVFKLNEAVNKVLAMQDVRQKIFELGAQPMGGTADDLAKQLHNELIELKDIVSKFKDH